MPNHLIRRAAWLAAGTRPNVRVECDARVTAVNVGAQRAQLSLSDGRLLHAPLVVAADSRLSQTRRWAGIGASMHDFGRSVVAGRLAHEHDNEGVAWECFRHGDALALLPMNDRRVSAVVTVPSDQARHWLALDDAAFAARVQSNANARLGTMRAAGPRHHYPLVGVYAHRFVAPRIALIGDAAVGMHPVTAHGWNFGLYGVEVLAQALRSAAQGGRDVGALTTLEPYEREHRRTTLPVYLGTQAVVSLFTDDRALPRRLRQLVLTVAQSVPPFNALVKSTITRQLTGIGPRWPYFAPPWRV